MHDSVLKVTGLTKKFGGLVAVNNVDFELRAGLLHAILGPNGAGKTTFFNLISGFFRPTSGSVVFDGRDITNEPAYRISRRGMARTLQVKSVFSGLSVYDNVWISAHSRNRFLNPFRSAATYKETIALVEESLCAVGISALQEKIAGNLAYGDIALLEIAMAIAMRPKLLLLDEPVAGMSPEETNRTVDKIKELSRTVNILLIEHDVEAVFRVADRVTVMAQGMVLCEGTSQEVATNPRVQEAYLGMPEEVADA